MYAMSLYSICICTYIYIYIYIHEKKYVNSLSRIMKTQLKKLINNHETGVAEERENRYVSEHKSLKLREAELIGKLGDAEFKASEQSSKLISLQLGKLTFTVTHHTSCITSINRITL